MSSHFSFEDHAWDWDARRTRFTNVYDSLGQLVAVTVWLKRPSRYFQIHGQESVRQFLLAARRRERRR